jgi:hypothetical protein
MKEYSQEQIQQRYKALPEELKSFLASTEEVDTLEEICNKHELSEKFMEIQKNIALVSLGLSNFNDFKNYIFSICKTESIGQIAYQQIFNMIFLPVMHLIDRQDQTPPTAQTPKPQAPQKHIETQENVPFINKTEIAENPPMAKPQNTIEQIRAIKSMDKSQVENLTKYHQDDDMPNARRSFDSYREPIE